MLREEVLAGGDSSEFEGVVEFVAGAAGVGFLGEFFELFADSGIGERVGVFVEDLDEDFVLGGVEGEGDAVVGLPLCGAGMREVFGEQGMGVPDVEWGRRLGSPEVFAQGLESGQEVGDVPVFL